jgi:hypothetical protein
MEPGKNRYYSVNHAFQFIFHLATLQFFLSSTPMRTDKSQQDVYRGNTKTQGHGAATTSNFTGGEVSRVDITTILGSYHTSSS